MVNLQVPERLVRTASDKNAKYLTVRNSNNVRANGANFSTPRKWATSPWKSRKRTRSTKKWMSFIRQPWDRCITVFVYLFALGVLTFMIIDETETYHLKPMATTIDDDMFPVQNVTFPAIAICSINVLSRRKVANFAKELSQMDKFRRVGNVTVEKLRYLLRYMGHVYTFSNWETNPGDIKLLENILITLFGPDYNIERVMAHILPPCRSSFEHCSWGGEIRACEELFAPRWTHEGLCCVFNYVRWSNIISSDGKADYSFYMERSKYAGYEYGLRVFLNPDFEDNYYNLLPARGYKLLLFSATDYPDPASGGLKEIMVGPGGDRFIKVKGTAFYSSPDVLHFDKSKRKCLFSNELYEEYGGTYSYSQCVMLCRTRDIFNTCGCVPFFYPYPAEFKNVRDCTLQNLHCLRANRYKWWSIQPPLEEANKHTWDNNDTNLACDCLPSCDVVDFSVSSSNSQIHHYDSSLVDFVKNHSPSNVTKDSIVLSISFEHPTIPRFRQDVMYYWYDLMSAYGGLCSMFLGLSILRPIEFIYELYVHKWEKRNKTNSSSERDEVPAITKSTKMAEAPIYWKEIMKQK